MMEATDRSLMQKAIEQARKGLGQTSPNPPVGAVLVKNGSVVAKGYHRCAGEAHAEVDAINNATEDLKGATLYVTLEPCSTVGRTGACTEAIKEASISRVVVGSTDPTLANGSKAKEVLEASGIAYEEGLLKEETDLLIKSFSIFQKKQRPYVTLKVAMSLDGRIAYESGDSRWITNEASRERVHQFREEVDAILVGKQTFLLDDPLLTARKGEALVKTPLRVVIFPDGEIPEQAKMFQESPEKVLCVSVVPVLSDSLRKNGIQELIVSSREPKILLQELMHELYNRGVMHLLLEGGAKTYQTFLDAGLVDHVMTFIAPKILGGSKYWLPAIADEQLSVWESLSLKDVKITQYDTDVCIEGDY